jgi:hypothetical protein
LYSELLARYRRSFASMEAYPSWLAGRSEMRLCFVRDLRAEISDGSVARKRDLEPQSVAGTLV